MYNGTEVNIMEKQIYVPYISHEEDMARMERANRRLSILATFVVVLLFVSNALWVWLWNQYEYVDTETVTTSIDQDGEGNNIIGDGNEVDNESESNSNEDENTDSEESQR